MKNINPVNIAKYIVFRYFHDGDTITNLKLQKVLYYVYVWYLINNKKSCIKEKFQAWANGPVLPSVYNKLKKYKAMPINVDFVNVHSEEEFKTLKESLGSVIGIIDKVYEKYGTKSAFELVNLTHADTAWKKARKELSAGEISTTEISNKDILAEYEK